MKKSLLITAVAGAVLLLGACDKDKDAQFENPVVQDQSKSEIPVANEFKQTITSEIAFTGVKYSNVKLEELKPKLNAYLFQTAEDLRLIGEKNSKYVIVSAEYEILGNSTLDWKDMHTQYLVREDGYKVQVKGEVISSDIYEDAGYEAMKPMYWGMEAATKGKQYFVFPVGNSLLLGDWEWYFTVSELNNNAWANEKIPLGKVGGE